MTLELLDEELERLRQLRISLTDDEKLLEERQAAFRRTNANLIQSIDVKKGNIRLSEQKIKNIATEIYARVQFYMNLDTVPISPLFFTETVEENEMVEVCPQEEPKRANRNVLSYFGFRR